LEIFSTMKLINRIKNRLKRSQRPVRLKRNPLELGRLSAWHRPDIFEEKYKN